MIRESISQWRFVVIDLLIIAVLLPAWLLMAVVVLLAQSLIGIEEGSG